MWLQSRARGDAAETSGGQVTKHQDVLSWSAATSVSVTGNWVVEWTELDAGSESTGEGEEWRRTQIWGGTKGGPRAPEGWQGHAEFRLGMVELRCLEIPTRRRTGLSWTHGSVAQTYKSGNGELSPGRGVSGVRGRHEAAPFATITEDPLAPPSLRTGRRRILKRH